MTFSAVMERWRGLAELENQRMRARLDRAGYNLRAQTLAQRIGCVEAVAGDPGIRADKIRAEVGIKDSTLRNHLRQMTELGVIQGVREHGSVWWYPTGAAAAWLKQSRILLAEMSCEAEDL